MNFPSDLVAYIKEFLPPHPLQKEINVWKRTKRTYFYKHYFQNKSDQKEKIKRFIDHNDFWIRMSGLNNEDAIKLKHKCNLDKKRMKEKLNQMGIKQWQCSTTTHIPKLNKHGNFSEVFYKGQEIIY